MIVNKEIVFIDLETTGVDVMKDRIVEISAIKISKSGVEEKRLKRLKPGIEISPEAMEIHKITNEDVKDCPNFRQISNGLYKFIKNCDIAGFGIKRFDVPLLQMEFERSGINNAFTGCHIIDVMDLFFKMNPRTLSDAYAFYKGEVLENAHSAECDNVASMEILNRMMLVHPEISDLNTMQLEEFAGNKSSDLFNKVKKDKDGFHVFNFGKHYGKRIVNHKEYVDYLERTSNMPKNVINTLKMAIITDKYNK